MALIFRVRLELDDASALVISDVDYRPETETSELRVPPAEYPIVISTDISYRFTEEDGEDIKIFHRVGLSNPIVLAVWVAPIAKKYGLCVGRHCLGAISRACYDVYQDHGDELSPLHLKEKCLRFMEHLVERKAELGGEALAALGSCAIEAAVPPLPQLWAAAKRVL